MPAWGGGGKSKGKSWKYDYDGRSEHPGSQPSLVTGAAADQERKRSEEMAQKVVMRQRESAKDSSAMSAVASASPPHSSGEEQEKLDALRAILVRSQLNKAGSVAAAPQEAAAGSSPSSGSAGSGSTGANVISTASATGATVDLMEDDSQTSGSSGYFLGKMHARAERFGTGNESSRTAAAGNTMSTPPPAQAAARPGMENHPGGKAAVARASELHKASGSAEMKASLSPRLAMAVAKAIIPKDPLRKKPRLALGEAEQWDAEYKRLVQWIRERMASKATLQQASETPTVKYSEEQMDFRELFLHGIVAVSPPRP